MTTRKEKAMGTMDAPTTTYSIDQLRGVLSEAIDDLRNERSSPSNVNAISNACGKMLNTLRLQIDYQEMTGIRRPIQMLEDAS